MNTTSQTAQLLISTLAAHGVMGARVVGEHHGSAVVRYDLATLPGTRAEAVKRLGAELAQATSSQAVRVEVVPGTPFLGVEVPSGSRPTVEAVNLPRDETPLLAFHVGNGTDGEPIIVDLAKLPHLLIAGQTGSGKSVAMTGLISQIMARVAPTSVKFLMADPKRVELALFAGSPHLAGPIATEVVDMLELLAYAVTLMEGRYADMQAAGVRNIADLPIAPFRLVICLDEISDLMLQTKGAAEEPIVRLAQLGRAAGVHLVLATQYPRADVVTPLISANIPSRLVFAVATHTQSKVALGHTGAERLLGRGDGLLAEAGNPVIQRILSPFLSDDEIRRAARTLPAATVAYGTPTAPVAPSAITLPPVQDAPVAPRTAPDGMSMGPDDKVCYLCNWHRAIPTTNVCLMPNCVASSPYDRPQEVEFTPLADRIATPKAKRRRWWQR